jgi:hypothetical protein
MMVSMQVRFARHTEQLDAVGEDWKVVPPSISIGSRA